jgi:hypothetical protein
MSYPASREKRHALGLPAGSVRAAQVLGVVALVCAIMLIPTKGGIPIAIPPYLVYLLFLMLGHYFAAHGVTIATRIDPHPSPLYLPGGVVRVLVVVALGGCIGWKLYSDETGLRTQFELSLDALKTEPFLPLVILGGFFLGVIVHAFLGWEYPPAALQDLEAWISLLSLAALSSAAIIHLVINPSLDFDKQLHLPHWEGFVGGLIAFYFGARS